MKMLNCVAVLALSALGLGQTADMSLTEALKLARERNGTVRAAWLNAQAAEARVKQSFALFLPTVTPSYRYSAVRDEVMTGGLKGVTETTTNTSQVVANWQLLDSGERSWAYRASRSTREAERLAYLQTLRRTLFTVHQQYFDALRAQGLLKVAADSVKRASEVLAKTKAFAETGAGAKIDILQADADYENAVVQALTAKNAVATAESSLKATIGWDKSQALPSMQASPEPQTAGGQPALDKVIEDGLQARADLESQRRLLEAQRFGVLKARQQTFASWSLDASYGRQFSDNVSENRSLTFLVTVPLFDGGFLREAAREANLSYESSKSTLVQAERDARAEIETAYLTLTQNRERVAAAQKALNAAQKNYEAASDSFKLGASTLIDVLTAQVTLTTAESNHIEAVYDYYTSEVDLRLVTGQSILGEDLKQ